MKTRATNHVANSAANCRPLRHLLHDLGSFLDLLCDFDTSAASVWIGDNHVVACLDDGGINTATLQLSHDVVFETLSSMPAIWQTERQLAEFLRLNLPAHCGAASLLEKLRGEKAFQEACDATFRTSVYANAGLSPASIFCDFFYAPEEDPKFLLKPKPGELQRLKAEAAAKLREKIVRTVEQLCGEKVPCYLGEP